MHYKHSFSFKDYSLNLTVLKQEGKMFFDFNHHFEIEDLVVFKDKLSDYPIVSLISILLSSMVFSLG